MRAVVQRVSQASVSVESQTIGSIATGLVVLLGITRDDTVETARTLAAKIWRLRILRDEKSAEEISAEILVISQFTLYGDTRKGRRPSWGRAAPGAVAEPIYEEFCSALEQLGAPVARGKFGADMAVTLTNDGPVTLMMES